MPPMHPSLARLRLQAEVDAARGRLARPIDTLDAIAGDGNGNVAIPNSHDIVCRDAATGRVLFATNPDLHVIEEGEALALVPMNDRAPMLWRVPPPPAPALNGLFVAAFTDSTNGTTPGWKILKFVDLPLTTYTDLGTPSGFNAEARGMAVANTSLYVWTGALWVYHAGAWSAAVTFPLALHSGSRFMVKHDSQVYILFKTAATTVSRFVVSAAGVATLVDSFTVGSSETIQYMTSLTPDGPGDIRAQLSGGGVRRLVSWDGAALTTIVTSPAYIGAGANSNIDFYEATVEGGLPIVYAAADDDTTFAIDGGLEQTWQRSNGGVAFGFQHNLTFFVNEEETAVGRYSPSPVQGDSGLAIYQPDGAGGVWIAGNMRSSVSMFGDNTVVYGETHFGATHPPADSTLVRENYTMFAHHTAGGDRTFVASYYTATGSANEAIFRHCVTIGDHVYVSLGKRRSGAAAGFTAATPMGIFRYPTSRIGAFERWLPTDALTVLGGCGRMLAHDVTEAAAV